MKKTLSIVIGLLLICTTSGYSTNSWIRINQLGYLPTLHKVAVYMALEESTDSIFTIKNLNDSVVFTGTASVANAKRWGMKEAHRLDFSSLRMQGNFYIDYNNTKSPIFKIADDVYDGAADFLLNYMRQQRCGYNPYLNAHCHQNDGYIVDDPIRNNEKIDVRGGWHDATDYLQYLTTSANATFQMLFAWQQNPNKEIFKDQYNADGRKGSNGIPDILDEAKWGLEWMIKMNPDSTRMYNQIADDRDHAGFRLPTEDKVDYGWGPGKGRPVFPITGKPQGLTEGNKNRSTGVASSAAKFSSAFTLGASIFKDIDPEMSQTMDIKASQAYNWSKALPGNNQTACTVSPYFYEEDNWVDDMELAASVNFYLTSSTKWLSEADYWGQLEEVTPWMELGRARHYQFYPFVNLGHFYLASSSDSNISTKYQNFMKQGLEHLLKRASDENDPFLYGIPFIWCSNNLVAAALTQAQLYYQITRDEQFIEMEAALRDWLFGCNPWGTSMISGLPGGEHNANKVHSSYYILSKNQTPGGLVDGPIYNRIYATLRGIQLHYEDPLAPFQNGVAVYHNDPGDYSSNEPTMDGTASLTYYLSTMERIGKESKDTITTDKYGAVTRVTKDRDVFLIFSVDQTFEGARRILNTLKQKGVKGSFFLTGNALRNPKFKEQIERIIAEGHYLGGHSDKHLLYANWEERETLVTPDSLISDLQNNLVELRRWGVAAENSKIYLPPYEWYNAEQVKLINQLGLTTINFSEGLRTAADYTTPDMENYASSKELLKHLYEYEKVHTLNGAIILIHPGTVEERVDKLYNNLDTIILSLRAKGYTFKRF